MDSGGTFEQTYPALTRWVREHGWLEIGRDSYSRSLVRVLDEGGLIWEGGTARSKLSATLAEADAAIAAWLREQFPDD